MNFEETYKEFKIYVEKRHKKQGFNTITSDFNKHVLPYFIGKDIKQLNKLDIVNWQNLILSKNFTNKFNSKLYYIFSSFIKFCYENDYIEYDIFQEVSRFPKKIEIKKHIVYNLRQFYKFRFYLSDFVIKQFFTFMFFYGTRPSEAMALRFCDLKKNYIYIRHSIHRKGKRELDTPKNQSSIRILKINVFMLVRILLLKKYYIKKYNTFSVNYFIFGGKKPLAPTTIDRHKKSAYTKAKLPPITQHGFRHSYATRNIHNKVPIDKVSKTMGHSKVSTTLDIYLHDNLKFDDSLFQ